MMTKKDFIALADYVRDANIDQCTQMKLCEFMRSRNPNFKTFRWLEYLAGNCGPNGGKISKTKWI